MESHHLYLQLLHVHALPAKLLVGKTHRVRITSLTPTPCDASRLSIWVGVAGPELHGGVAVPDGQACAWSYDLNVGIAGEYQVDVRVLHWDGEIDVDMSGCHFQLSACSSRL